MYYFFVPISLFHDNVCSCVCVCIYVGNCVCVSMVRSDVYYRRIKSDSRGTAGSCPLYVMTSPLWMSSYQCARRWIDVQ